MSTTDISEKGLETLIMRHMTGTDVLVFAGDGACAETPDALAAAKAAGSGWLAGNLKDYDRTHALDVPQLFVFLHATQPDTVKKLGIGDYRDSKDINRQKFLARLSNEIGGRSSSSSGAAWCISPWTTPKYGCARSCAAKARGFCRSTKAGTTARAIRPTPAA